MRKVDGAAYFGVIGTLLNSASLLVHWIATDPVAHTVANVGQTISIGFIIVFITAVAHAYTD